MDSKIKNEIKKLKFELQPGEEDEFTAAQFGAAGNTFLMIFNPDKFLGGDWVVGIK
jgi:hypothetical protein